MGVFASLELATFNYKLKSGLKKAKLCLSFGLFLFSRVASGFLVHNIRVYQAAIKPIHTLL